jgi:hypothetical protein
MGDTAADRQHEQSLMTCWHFDVTLRSAADDGYECQQRGEVTFGHAYRKTPTGARTAYGTCDGSNTLTELSTGNWKELPTNCLSRL